VSVGKEEGLVVQAGGHRLLQDTVGGQWERVDRWHDKERGRSKGASKGGQAPGREGFGGGSMYSRAKETTSRESRD